MLADALRGNSTLTSLTLSSIVGATHVASVAAVFGALTGHASLRTLCLRNSHMGAAKRAALNAALGALVAANAPALTELDVSDCYLGDDGLRALFTALPRNTHLRKLACATHIVSGPFARDVLLPSVRANTSLCELDTGPFSSVSTAEAKDIVSRRAEA
jgi:hypothetical protein